MSYIGLGVDVGEVVKATLRVAEDPCLAPVTRTLLKLHAIDQERAPVDEQERVRGIGLCHARKPLELLYKMRKKPWLPLAYGVGAVGALIAVGYVLGKSK